LPGGAACGRGSHLDSGRCVVCDGRAVEEWLEAHRHLWSPNTVRGYAASLAQWWSFLEQRGGAVGRGWVPAVAGSCRGCASAAPSSML
jgi:hypothetical protein